MEAQKCNIIFMEKEFKIFAPHHPFIDVQKYFNKFQLDPSNSVYKMYTAFYKEVEK